MSTFSPSPEQRAVIEHPVVPLRVSAGAGTGKTTTMSHRIARMVIHHGIEPEQVLGITFTNKAAEELADRVRQALGSRVDAGRQVEIHTYHGFAAQMLTEFGALVGVERNAGIVTPTFTRQILSEVVRALPLPNLNQTAPAVIDQIRKLAASIGDNLVDPTSLLAPPGSDEPWPARLDLLAAVAAYEAEKRRLGVVDYTDLIASAHRLVDTHPWVADKIRGRFRSLVLDEYQDTNPAQRVLLTAVFGDGFPVTAVGDPDQTIYEWRGASPANFASFPRHFAQRDGAPADDLPLSVNRRSGPEILMLANAIRARIDDLPRTPLSPVEGAPEGAVRTAWFGDAVAEAEWIADDVHQAHLAGRRWSDMAVLFRKNKDMALVRDALAARDVPVEVANLGGLLSVPEVVEIHAWMRILERPEDTPALARILTGSRYRLGLGDLAVLARWVRRRVPDEDDDTRTLVSPTLLEAIEHVDDLDDLRPAARAALVDLARRYRSLLEAAQGVTLVELARRILDATGAWRDVEALSPAARLSARLNLYRFLDLTEAWSPLEGRPSLGAFLDYLATMDDEPAEELDTARLAGADAVTLVTVHRAKGLEWPTVYLPAVYRNNFPSRVAIHDNPHVRPESLPYEYRIDRAELPPLDPDLSPTEQSAVLKRRHDAQEWRIAYVAVTRAKEAITVTGAHWYGNPEPTKKPAVPSDLYALVAGHQVTSVLTRPGDPPDRPDTIGYRSERLPAPDPVFTSWQHGLRATIDDPDFALRLATDLGVAASYHAAVTEFEQLVLRLPDHLPATGAPPTVTSVTGLVTYASCPLRYYWSDVDRLPRRYSPAARRGVEVHRRIELHHRGVIPPEDIQPTLYDAVVSEFTEEHEDLPESGPFEAFAGSRFAAVRPYVVEAPFEITVGRSTTVRGRIDALYRSGDDWEIVDFKSGRPSSDPSVTVQLQAYALAVSRGGFSVVPPSSLRVTFAYLGEGLVERTRTADPSWLETAQERLDALATGIEEGQFDATPSPACHRCDFLHVCDAGRRAVAT